MLSAIAAFVLLLGWFALVIRLGLPYAESEGLVFFVAVSFVVLVVLGRWLARLGSFLVVLGMLPVCAVFFGGWAGIGDEILLSRGKTVEAVLTAEVVHRLKGGGPQDPTVPLVFACLGLAGLIGAIAVTAVTGERRRVRNATTR